MNLAIEIGAASAGQHQVADDGVERTAVVDRRERGPDVADGGDAMLSKEPRQRGQEERIVVHDENAERPLGRRLFLAHPPRVRQGVQAVKPFDSA